MFYHSRKAQKTATITSDDFKIFQQDVYDKYQAEIQSIIVSDFEYVEEENIPYTIEAKSKSSYVTEIIAISEQNESNKEVEAALEIGKPLQFEKNETHSFSWRDGKPESSNRPPPQG